MSILATDLGPVNPDSRGDQRLYRLSEPVPCDDRETEYVVVSAVIPWFGGGPETLIFPADEDGEITSFGEIDGYRGGLDHATAIRIAGWELE